MRSLRELLDALPLPAAAAGGLPEYVLPSASLLGGDLPPGHLHVWSGPPGAGKTAFLLGLLHDAARHGRPAVLATYDLSASSLALRLLAMSSGVAVHDMEEMVASGRTPSTNAVASAAARARARLALLPLYVLEARGMSVSSIEDRLVRSPVRAEVLGVDFLEAVVRPPETPVEGALADLSDLASRRFVSVVCVTREGVLDRAVVPDRSRADRVGRIAPAGCESAAGIAPATGLTGRDRRVDATLLANRHGIAVTCRLRVDADAARLLPDDPAPAARPG